MGIVEERCFFYTFRVIFTQFQYSCFDSSVGIGLTSGTSMLLARLFRLSPVAATLLLFVAFSVVVAPVKALPVPHPKQHGDYKREVEALEEQWRLNQLANDVAGMDNLLSDDYIGISMTGKVYTKAQQLERMKNRDLMLTRINIDEMKVKLIGTIAIVTSHTDIEGVNDGLPVKGTYRYTRIYKRLPSGIWKITSFEATRSPRSNGDEAKAP
jgi:ketosteroid isomerase-like protein